MVRKFFAAALVCGAILAAGASLPASAAATQDLSQLKAIIAQLQQRITILTQQINARQAVPNATVLPSPTAVPVVTQPVVTVRPVPSPYSYYAENPSSWQLSSSPAPRPSSPAQSSSPSQPWTPFKPTQPSIPSYPVFFLPSSTSPYGQTGHMAPPSPSPVASPRPTVFPTPSSSPKPSVSPTPYSIYNPLTVSFISFQSGTERIPAGKPYTVYYNAEGTAEADFFFLYYAKGYGLYMVNPYNRDLVAYPGVNSYVWNVPQDFEPGTYKLILQRRFKVSEHTYEDRTVAESKPFTVYADTTAQAQSMPSKNGLATALIAAENAITSLERLLGL